MATADNILRAKALASLGLYVFPVNVSEDPENPFKKQKRPSIAMAHDKNDPLRSICHGECGKRGHGFYDALIDPGFIEDMFERYPNAEVGVWMEPSGLVAADIDVKRNPEGEILVDGFEEFDKAWLELPTTHAFDSISGAGGKQYIYTAPEGVKLGPDSNYRGIQGVDRRGGGSYSVWNGPVPTSRDVFTPAPEWLLDEKTVRSAEQFEGDVKEWYDSLEQGEPSVIVRAAMDRTREQFERGGNDFSHSDLVERQFEAVRLGSEGHPGVPQLLALIEELFHSRTGAHSRGEDEWDYEFQEALSSGIQKHGGATELRKALPAYSLAIVPSGVPDRLVSGAPGNKDTFRELLAELLRAGATDHEATSVLWNSPRTKDIAREWGLEFVFARVQSAREKPEPIRENPTLPEITPAKTDSSPVEVSVTAQGLTFLSAPEQGIVSGTYTFIDMYLASSRKKGFSVPAYDIPGAWTALSMAIGPKVVTKFNGVGVNLWFIEMGNTGTGKSVSQAFLSGVLDTMLLDGEGNYNLGANSSPAGIHEELLIRDGKASMIHHDEAASFFSDLVNSEWFKSLEHHFSKFYDGVVEPSNKVRLDKNLRGKKARTSFNLNMSATPEKLLKLVTLDMFESGFLSRVNWTWAPPRIENSERYTMAPSEIDANVRAHPAVYDLALDLSHAQAAIPNNTPVDGTPEAWDRLSKANEEFHQFAKKQERYDILQGPLTRLSETMVKCAALLALYRGETVFTEKDVWVAISYCTDWFFQFMQVVSQASESAFSRDANEIEAFIRAEKSVSEAKLMNRFRNMVRNSPRELSDRVEFLRISGRINRVENDRRVTYVING